MECQAFGVCGDSFIKKYNQLYVMVNKYQRMRQVNGRIKAMLKARGYFDFYAIPHLRFSKDLFGLFDFICKQPHIGEDKFRIVFCQFKCGGATTELKRKIKEFCEASGQLGLLVEYIKRKGKYEYKITKF